MEELYSNRICTMMDGLYMIIDWYPYVQNQPLIVIFQLNETQLAEKNMRIQLPVYLEIEKEISDIPEYSPISLAKKIISEEEEKKVSPGDEK